MRHFIAGFLTIFSVLLQSCTESKSLANAAAPPVVDKSLEARGKELPPLDAAEDGASATERKSTRRRKTSGDRNVPRGEAGEFDFFVLSLSWSPNHCSTPAGEHDRDQCGGLRQYNFVVHGLWPQYDPRGWPQDCGGDPQVAQRLIREMLPLMPSPKLIAHEWQKHGTCSGLGQQAYFAKVKEARAKVKIPTDYQSPSSAVRTSIPAIKANFLAANPGMNNGMLGVICSGRFLQEVDVCLTKDLQGRDCSDGVHDTCSARSVTLRPLR